MNRSTATPHIGYVVKMFPRLSETFILNEILELERQGLSLHIFSLKRPTEPGAEAEASRVQAPITYLPERALRQPWRILCAHFGVFRRYGSSYLRALLHVVRGRELRSLVRGLRRFSQTCCLVHEMGEVRHLHAHFATDPTRLASWAHMICGIPYSVTTHAKDLYQGDRINSPGLHYKLSLARFIIANSQMSADALRAGFKDQVRAPVYTIYNGVDLTAFPLRQDEPATPLILSVGRLVDKKGFSNLVRACQLLKTWGTAFRCEIVGTGPLARPLREQIKECGLEQHVRLLGSMPAKDLRDYYHKATIFALPCVVATDGDRDILPNVLKEAMASGVPVVTTRLPGIEELITHGEDGLLVPPADVEALATSLECLLADAALRRKLAARARKVIEQRFDLRANFALLGNLLRETAKEPTLLVEQPQNQPTSTSKS